MTWVYIKSEPRLWTVGFYRPDGEFESESDYRDCEEAADRVHYLNGGARAETSPVVSAHIVDVKAHRPHDATPGLPPEIIDEIGFHRTEDK